MLNTIIKLIIQVIFTYIRRLYYKNKVNKANEKAKKSKKQMEVQRAKSDKAYNDFLKSYSDYLATRGELRQNLKEVRSSSERAAKDDKESGQGD